MTTKITHEGTPISIKHFCTGCMSITYLSQLAPGSDTLKCDDCGHEQRIMDDETREMLESVSKGRRRTEEMNVLNDPKLGFSWHKGYGGDKKG